MRRKAQRLLHLLRLNIRSDHPLQESPMFVSDDWSEEERDLRVTLFDHLDRLAFALEMEASEYLEEGREDRAEHYTQVRLGVRLAQRLVSGVWSDEVHSRLNRWTAAYDVRTGATP